MPEVYVIETSILLSEGKKAFYSFPGSKIIIPLACVQDLEDKRNDSSLGFAARSALRELDSLRETGDLNEGVKLSNGSEVRVEINHTGSIPRALASYPSSSANIKVITVAKSLDDELEEDVILISKNVPLKILASLVNLQARDFTGTGTASEHIDTTETIEISGEDIQTLFEKKSVVLPPDVDVPRNVGVILKAGTSSALATSGTGYSFDLVTERKAATVTPANAEQRLAIDYLFDDDIRCVSLGGVPGGGKSLLALAAGIDQIQNGKSPYKKISVLRSMQAVGGEELGYLPGSEGEKMDPWTKAVYDVLGMFLTHSEIQNFKTKGLVEVIPLTHIRGRTLDNSWVVLDEAQNVSKSTILTVLSRLGQNSKAVMTWDIAQRDNLYVGRYDGVYDVVSKMLGNKLFAHVSMQTSKRSDLAQVASDLLDDYK